MAVLSIKEWSDRATSGEGWKKYAFGGQDINADYAAYLNSIRQADQSQLDVVQQAAETAGALTLLESVSKDIAARDVGRRKLKERQSARQANMVGRIAPRTQQQTASLLSSTMPATGTTLLG